MPASATPNAVMVSQSVLVYPRRRGRHTAISATAAMNSRSVTTPATPAGGNSRAATAAPDCTATAPPSTSITAPVPWLRVGRVVVVGATEAGVAVDEVVTTSTLGAPRWVVKCLFTRGYARQA